MSKRKNKYDITDELSAASAFLAAGNVFMDAADIAYRREDTDSLMVAGEHLLRLAAVMMQGPSAEAFSSLSPEDETEVDPIEDGIEKVKIGFVK